MTPPQSFGWGLYFCCFCYFTYNINHKRIIINYYFFGIQSFMLKAFFQPSKQDLETQTEKLQYSGFYQSDLILVFCVICLWVI